jgi:signal transduction histidine kinase
MSQDRSKKVFEDAENDRRRIARELHDDIGQRMAMFASEVDLLSRELQLSDEPSRRLKSLAQQARDLTDDLRRLSHTLHPVMLEELGLVPALRALTGDFALRTGLAVSFNESDVPRHLPPALSLALYRITQEALRNVAKHARAASVQVSLVSAGGEIHLDIADSGAGFDSSGNSGLGLVSMRERTELLGGIFTVNSASGSGTAIQVRVPFAKGQTT